MPNKRCEINCECGLHKPFTKERKSKIKGGSSKCKEGCQCGRHKGISYGPMSEAHKLAISTANSGKIRSEEIRKEMSERNKLNPTMGMLGKKHSEKTRKQMSESSKKQWEDGGKERLISNETKAKLRIKTVLAWKEGRRKKGDGKSHTRIRKAPKSQRNLLNKRTLNEWRTLIFKRDDYTCQICGQRGSELNADHIISKWSDTSLIYSLGNGRTLCRPCHVNTDTFGNRATLRGKHTQLPLPMVTE